MSKDEISPEVVDRYEDDLDLAVLEVLSHLNWLGLPDDEADLERLVFRLSEAIDRIMKEYL